MTTARSLLAAVAAALACGAAAGRCEAQTTTRSARTKPAPPARATVPFDQLTPPVSKPTGRPEARKLSARSKKLVDEARQQLSRRKTSEAIRQLERALGYDPGNPQILRLLGQAYLALPNRGKAVTNLTAAAEAAPDDLDTQVLLGQLAAGQRRTDKAIEHLRTALKCSAAKPESGRAAEALLTLALILDRERYWTAALECYTRLGRWIEDHGRSYAERKSLREWVLRSERLHARRGALLLLLGQRKQAAELLRRAYRRNRTQTGTAKLLVEALLGDGQYAEVEKLLLEMGSQPTQQPNVPELAAELCRQAGERELPLRLWKAYYRRRASDVAVAGALARTAQQMGWTDEAAAIVASILSARPTDAELWRILAGNYAQRKQTGELFEKMEQTLADKPEAADALAEGVKALAAAGAEGVEREFAALARKSKSPARAQLLYLGGLLATGRNKHQLAADLYRRAIDDKKDFLPAYEALLAAYLAQGRRDRIERLMEKVGRLEAGKHWPSYLRGKVALSRKDPAAAVEAFEKALSQKADDLPTMLLLAEAYTRAGRTAEALKTLKKAHADNPGNIEATRRLFDIHVAREELREARVLAGQVLREQRESIPGRLMLAELALLAGRRTEARQLLAELEKRAPQDIGVQLLAVRALIGATPGLVSKDDFGRASQKLRGILRLRPENRPARKRLAELLDAVDKTAESAGIWATLFDEAPKEAELAYSYVDALTRTEQHRVALTVIRRFRKAQPDALRARLAELRVLSNVKQYGDAEKLGLEWVKQTKDQNIRTVLFQELLRIFRVGDEHTRALKVVDAWIADKPDSRQLQRLRNSKIRLLDLAGRRDEAVRYADKLEQDEPLSQAGRMLVSAAIEAKQYDRALPMLAERIKRSGRTAKDIDAVAESVDALAAKKSGARKAYDERIKKVPSAVRDRVGEAVDAARYDRARMLLDMYAGAVKANVADLRMLKVAIYGEQKKLDQARREVKAWMADEPDALLPRQALVSVLADAERYDEADRLVTGWLKKLTPAEVTTKPATTKPTDATRLVETLRWLRETSVRVKISRRKHAEALAAAEEHLRLDPTNVELMSLRSACLGELGRGAEALAALEKALKIKPDDASLNNNLGYLYAERGIELDRAGRMLAKALRARPGELAFTDSLGWVLYKQGRLRQAGRVFQRIVKDRKDDQIEHGVILNHAGDVYYRLGWTDRAADFWRRGLKLMEKMKQLTTEDREAIVGAKAKIEAVENGRPAEVAPLGQGMKPVD